MDGNKLTIALLALTLASIALGIWILEAKTGFKATGLISNPTGTVSAEVSGGTDIFLQVATVNFGTVQVGASYDGASDGNYSNASQFLLRNDGSVRVNVTVSATALWTSTSGNNTNYQFNATNTTGNTSLRDLCSVAANNWVTMPLSSSTYALCLLNFSDANDYAKISIFITVPTGESAGAKTSTVTFTASQG